jgi:uncharacterized protein (DUF427 family)
LVDVTRAQGRVRIERSPKRVRAVLAGETVADSTAPLLVWEVPFYPTYFFSASDVREDLLTPLGKTREQPGLGEATRYQVTVGTAEGEAYSFHHPKEPEVADHYALVWKTMDHWFEESEEVFVHARDPHTRIDVLASGRRVRVAIDGVTVADSTNASFLFETGLPTRHYFPKTDVRMDLMTSTDRRTGCPYKGYARYWTATVNGETHDNVLWGYESPFPESQRIAGLVAFYNEKVDLYVDEVLQPRPKSRFA